MKKNYLLAMIVALIFTSCSKTEDLIIPATGNQTESGVLNKKSKVIEVEGTLTYKKSSSDNVSCGDHWSEGYVTDGSYLATGKLEGLGNLTSPSKAWVNFPGGGTIHVGYVCSSFKLSEGKGNEIFLTIDSYDLGFVSSTLAVGNCNINIAGGTGKYQYATGSLTGYVENPLNGSFTLKLEGEVSY